MVRQSRCVGTLERPVRVCDGGAVADGRGQLGLVGLGESWQSSVRDKVGAGALWGALVSSDVAVKGIN